MDDIIVSQRYEIFDSKNRFRQSITIHVCAVSKYSFRFRFSYMFQYRIMYISASSMFDNRYIDMFNFTLSMDDFDDKYHNEQILNVINSNEPYVVVSKGEKDRIEYATQCMKTVMRQLPCIAEVNVIFQGI